MLYALFLPMFVHLFWVLILYGLLTFFRAPTVWGMGIHPDGSNPYTNIEKRVSANLSNQFEWPVFFYVICILVIVTVEEYNRAYVWLAWLFIGGRCVHTLVQVLTTHIRLRGLVFCINFAAVLAMWCVFLMHGMGKL